MWSGAGASWIIAPVGRVCLGRHKNTARDNSCVQHDVGHWLFSITSSLLEPVDGSLHARRHYCIVQRVVALRIRAWKEEVLDAALEI